MVDKFHIGEKYLLTLIDDPKMPQLNENIYTYNVSESEYQNMEIEDSFSFRIPSTVDNGSQSYNEVLLLVILTAIFGVLFMAKRWWSRRGI